MDARRLARRCLPLLAGALLLPAARGAAAPDLTISGADTDVWNVANPTPTYRVRGDAGAKLSWTLSGTTKKGTGATPLRLTFTGLKTGKYTLKVEQDEPKASAARKFTVDVTPPGVTIRTPAVNAVYLPGETVVADYSCSGAVSCAGSVADGAALPTETAGSGAFTVTALDSAGNPTTRTVAYVVGPAAPVITARPAGPVRGTRPVFGWSGGEPGATYTWQVLSGGAVISQGDTPGTEVALGPLVPGAYAFQVRQTVAAGRTGPFSVADPFIVTKGVADVALVRPTTRNASRLRPRAGRVVTAVRPLLAWRPAAGADLYNLQVYRVTATGMTKVRSLFPTGHRSRVAGLRSGERYAWRVWPFDRARGGYSSEPLGLSWFELRRAVRPSRVQMATDRRIAMSALRKAMAIEAWLDAGVTAGDLRHEGLGAAAFDPVLRPTGPPDAGGTAAASVRPIVVAAAGTGPGRIPVTAAELRQTRRIARAALTRVGALEARLGAGLTGGDIVDGTIGPEKLAPGVAFGSRRATTAAAPPSVTPTVPAAAVRVVPVTRTTILASQRLAQGAVRRADALRLRLLQGLSTADFKAGSIGSADLASTLRR
ncbi:MAG TPA: hypothetical protein VL422_06315 [Miltoncostaea sp.]|nr:hypothetical protein [Miltoncostaea sp.]